MITYSNRVGSVLAAWPDYHAILGCFANQNGQNFLYQKRSNTILQQLYIPLSRFRVNRGGDLSFIEYFCVARNSFCWKLTKYPVVMKQPNMIPILNSPLHSFLNYFPCPPYTLPCVRPLRFFCCEHRT